MLEFIESRGDQVRFDQYMQEHLFGEIGYYTSHIEFGQDFYTFGLHPIFATAIHSLVKRYGHENRDFLEIGGGNGTFQAMYLKWASKTRYIAVDASPKLSGEQRQNRRTKRILSIAEDLKIRDRSIHGVVFSNELIDCLPCRVFKVKNKRGRPTLAEEGWVMLVGSQLIFAFRPVDRDPFVEGYESYLRERRLFPEDESLISVSPKTEKVLWEMKRVLDRGLVLLADYGYCDRPNSSMESRAEIPYYRAGAGYRFVNDILRRPYETDITYGVDFGYLRWLAERMNFTHVVLKPQHLIFQELIEERPDLREILTSDDPLLQTRGFYVLILLKK